MDLIEQLAGIVGADRVLASPAALRAAARDESDLPGETPRCVVRPADADQVRRIVLAAREAGIPLTARGGGSSLEGSAIPSAGAVVVDFAGMSRVLEVDPDGQLAVVEPGVVFDALNLRLRPTGLFFPPSPGGSGDVATIGGMVSTDASGLYALRYGGTRRWVLALDVVTGTGEALRLGARVPKTSAGYDLKQLFIGSEGTLGLVTAITLRLAPVPPAFRRAAWVFPGAPEACAAAAEMAAYVPEIAALELADAETLDVLRRLPGLEGLPAGNALFVETHGRPQDCQDGIDAARGSAEARGGQDLGPAFPDPWDLRHRMTRSIREAAAPAGVVRTDCAVPLAGLAAFVAGAKAAAARSGRRMHVFGHAGLGILHFLMPLAGDGAWPRDEALAAKDRLAIEAVAAGGAVSGEHGIGLGNRESLRRADPAAIAWMRQVKGIFDPDGILNPGKVL